MKINSYKTKKLLEKSSVCGCFHCLQTFPSHEITEYVDKGLTAVCPKCGVDSVIGDNQVKNESLINSLKKHHISGFCWGYLAKKRELVWIPTLIYKKKISKENPELFQFQF